MATEKDLKYALEKLVKAVDNFTIAINIHPINEKSLKQLESADFDLIVAMSLAKEIVKKHETKIRSSKRTKNKI